MFLYVSATILKNALRPDDILARIGGDEFAIILYNFNENEMEKLVERIRESIEKYNLDFNKFEISISLGWDITRKGEKTVLDVMKEADSNMYADKIKHRNKSSRLSRSLYTS